MDTDSEDEGLVVASVKDEGDDPMRDDRDDEEGLAAPAEDDSDDHAKFGKALHLSELGWARLAKQYSSPSHAD